MFSGSIHTHSENSLTDSVASVEELVARAKEMGAPAMALTDHGTLIGTWDFLDACNSAGIKGIVGVEFYVGNNGQREHLIVLPKNEQGFRAISKAVTESNYNIIGGKPIANAEILKKWFGKGSIGYDNVIATSACVAGVLASAFLSNEKLEKEQEQLLKKKNKESDPNSPLYKQMFSGTLSKYLLGFVEESFSREKLFGLIQFSEQEKEMLNKLLPHSFGLPECEALYNISCANKEKK